MPPSPVAQHARERGDDELHGLVRERGNAQHQRGIGESVQVAFVQAFAADWDTKGSPSTFNRERDLLLMVFRVRRDRNGHSPANPWAAIRLRRDRGVAV